MPWLLLDRDGTLCVRKHYLTRADEIRLMPRVGHSLARATQRGVKLAVVTNQSAVGQGLLTPTGLEAIHNTLALRLKSYDVTIEHFFACMHLPADNCSCRKPKTGLFLQFQDMYGASPSDCVLVGDSPTDVDAANAWGCASVAITGPLFRSRPPPTNTATAAATAIDKGLALLLAKC